MDERGITVIRRNENRILIGNLNYQEKEKKKVQVDWARTFHLYALYLLQKLNLDDA